MRTEAEVVVVAVMVGMHQEGVNRDDDRTMTMTRVISTVVAIAMRTDEAEAVMEKGSRIYKGKGTWEVVVGVGNV